MIIFSNSFLFFSKSEYSKACFITSFKFEYSLDFCANDLLSKFDVDKSFSNSECLLIISNTLFNGKDMN